MCPHEYEERHGGQGLLFHDLPRLEEHQKKHFAETDVPEDNGEDDQVKAIGKPMKIHVMRATRRIRQDIPGSYDVASQSGGFDFNKGLALKAA